MTTALLTMTWALPLLLGTLAWHRAGAWLPVLATLPALLGVFVLPADTILEIPWLMLGVSLGLDADSRTLLLGSSLVWLSAALYAGDSLRRDPRAGRFRTCFLLAMAGNFLLLLAQDALAFYLGYALMGLAAYGLVAHRRAHGVRRAARTYLAWAMVGELLLFCALAAMAAAVGMDDLRFAALQSARHGDVVMLLLLAAFGIKLAVIGLHVWMPLAYAAAPAAGAAVLGGAMVNAGLLGWLRMLPIGSDGHADWGYVLLALGLLSTFYGVAVGLVQNRARVVLAYSSISQMGLLTIGVAVALIHPALSPMLPAALALFAVHHGLAKGGLFLALDLHRRSAGARWTTPLLVLLSVTLVGAPLTSGAVAKALYKASMPLDWPWILAVLFASGVATTLLMARFLYVALATRPRRDGRGRVGRVAVWLPAVAGLSVPFAAAPPGLTGNNLSGLAPLLVGGVIVIVFLRSGPLRSRLSRLRLPAGDLPMLLGHRTRRAWRRRAPRGTMALPSLPSIEPPAWLAGAEATLRSWPVAGAAWLLLCLLLIALAVLQA